MREESVTRLRNEERDRRVLELHEQVLEIEQRLIPTGLHVFGRTLQERGRADLLRMVASFDRPELGVRALPTLISEKSGADEFPAGDAAGREVGARESEHEARARESEQELRA